jgi:N4-gp56 family major capsid protein
MARGMDRGEEGLPMAMTIFDVNDPLAVQLWSRVFDVELTRSTICHRLIGTDRFNSVIIERDEMHASAGQQLTVGLRRQLTGAGQVGDNGTLKGNTEAIDRDRDVITINLLRHGVGIKGSMSQQRISPRIRDEAKSGLRDWGATRVDVSMFNQLGGNSYQNDEGGTAPPGFEYRYTGMQAAVIPDAAHWMISGTQATEALLDSAGSVADGGFNLGLVSDCASLASVMDVPIHPVKLGELECYAVVIHPYQARQLKNLVTETDWAKAQIAAMQGGQITRNPIFTSALGMWDNCVLMQSANVPAFDDTNAVALRNRTSIAATGRSKVARALFLGANSGSIAWGRMSEYVGGDVRWKWTEVLEDHENELEVGIAVIWGMKKTRYIGMATDYGVITISSYSPAPS